MATKKVDFERTLTSEEPNGEDYKTSLKALAVGYLKNALTDPTMQNKSPQEMAASSMTAAMTTGVVLRNGYLLSEGEIDEEQAAQAVATTVSTAVAVVPEGIKLMDSVIPGARVLATALEPIVVSLMPKVKEKVLPAARKIVRCVKQFAQRAVKAVVGLAQRVFNGFCSLFA